MKYLNDKIEVLSNLNWSTVMKILLALYFHGPQKKSQIAMKAGVSYDRGMRYLKFLQEEPGWVEFELTTDLKKIKLAKLSSEGYCFCKARILNSKMLKEKIIKKEKINSKEIKKKQIVYV